MPEEAVWPKPATDNSCQRITFVASCVSKGKSFLRVQLPDQQK